MSKRFWLGLGLAAALNACGGAVYIYQLQPPPAGAMATLQPLAMCARQQGLEVAVHPDSVNVRHDPGTWVQFMVRGSEMQLVLVLQAELPPDVRRATAEAAHARGDQIWACAMGATPAPGVVVAMPAPPTPGVVVRCRRSPWRWACPSRPSGSDGVQPDAGRRVPHGLELRHAQLLGRVLPLDRPGRRVSHGLELRPRTIVRRAVARATTRAPRATWTRTAPHTTAPAGSATETRSDRRVAWTATATRTTARAARAQGNAPGSACRMDSHCASHNCTNGACG
jgi:hypothetical protein